MMTSPGTGPIVNGTTANVPVHTTQLKNGSPQISRATPGSRIPSASAKVSDAQKVPLERFDVSADLEINGASVSFNGNVTISQKGSSFEADLSLMYFEVVIVSTNGIARQLDLGGEHNLKLHSGELALIFSPGSRSSGSSYLAAVRQITAGLSKQLVRPRAGAPAQRTDDAAARQAEAVAARQRAIDTAAATAAQVSQASTQPRPAKKAGTSVAASHSSPNPAETPVIVKTKKIQAQPVSGNSLLKTVASLASLIKSDNVNHTSKSVSQTYSQPVKTMTDNIVAHTKENTDGSGQNIMKVVIDEHDVKGRISIVHSILAEEQGDSRGTIFDQAL